MNKLKMKKPILPQLAALTATLSTMLLSGCTEEAARGVVAGSVALYAIGGIILFLLVIFALVDIVKSSAPTSKKLLWVLIILIIPFVGAILYFLMGREGAKSF